MSFYRISNINLRVEPYNDKNLKRFEEFVCEAVNDIDIDIDVELIETTTLPKIEGKIVYQEDAIIINKPHGGIAMYMLDKTDIERGILGLLDANEDFSKVKLYYIADIDMYGYTSVEMIIGAIFKSRIIYHNGIVMHASAIEWNKKGVLFTAPSGTGKSTQSTLWSDHMGASILNDDCPAIRIDNEGISVFGTPWSGSTTKFINDKAKLSAIIVLEQNSQNSICKITNSELAKHLLPRFYLPYQDNALLDRAIKVIESIINTIPVYLLKCRPDLEAVELVKKCLME